MTRDYRPFTASEDAKILASTDDIALAKALDRPVKAIYSRRFGLKSGAGQRPRQPWTQEHDKAITAPARPSDAELAQRLGRSVPAIQVRRSRLSAP